VAPCAQLRKVWLAPTARLPCSNTANRRAQDLEDAKWILHLPKFRYGATAAENVHILYQPGKDQTLCKVWLASFEWRGCSNEAKTQKPLKLAEVPETNETISATSRLKFTYCGDMWRRYCCLTSFFPIVNTCLSCEDIARQNCAMVPKRQFFGDFLHPAFPASHVQYIWDLLSEFALRPHHMWKCGRHPICDGWD